MIQLSPSRYFKTSPEIIRLGVMMHKRLPLCLHNVGGLLHQSGIDVSDETIRFWSNSLGGSTDIRLPIELDVVDFKDDGSRIRSNKAKEEFLACGQALINSLQ